MKLELIEAFIAVVDGGSIRAGAKQLNRSQPGLSKKIRALEAELGVPLMVRSAQGIELTRYGEHFLVRARTIVNETERARAEMDQLRGALDSVVRISVAPASTVDLIPQTVRLFQHQFPATRLEIYEGLQAVAVEQLRSGQIDYAVCPLWEPLPASEFSFEVLETMPMAVVTNAQSRFAACTTLTELEQANWIHIGAGASLSPLVVKVFEAAGLSTPTPTMECFSLTSTLGFLFAADAVALLPAKLTQVPQYADHLIQVPIAQGIPSYPLYIIHRKDSPMTLMAGHLATILTRVAHNKLRLAELEL